MLTIEIPEWFLFVVTIWILLNVRALWVRLSNEKIIKKHAKEIAKRAYDNSQRRN